MKEWTSKCHYLAIFTRSFGNRASGSTSVSFPTHSATTFLVPSSALSKCWNRTPLDVRRTSTYLIGNAMQDIGKVHPNIRMNSCIDPAISS